MAQSNFQKYIQDSQPTGLSKADIYKSQEMLATLSSVKDSVDANIKSGMFEEDMLQELKEIKKLLKTDLPAAVARSNSYAPTVQAMNSGVQGSTNLPIVPQNSLNWLTEKRITNSDVLRHNLSLIKAMWGSTPSAGFAEGKPMTSNYSHLTAAPTHPVTASSSSQDKQDAGSSKSHWNGKVKQIGQEAKASAMQALSTVSWAAAPASPYIDIMKTMWDFVKPLRSVVEATVGTGYDAAKYLGKGSVEVIDRAWKDAMEAHKKTKQGSENLDTKTKQGSENLDTKTTTATSTKLQPAQVEFPKDISINNFGEFESWLETWLGALLEEKHITDLEVCDALKDLLDKSDAHLALLSFIAEKLDLPNLQQQVYNAGVLAVAQKPQLEGTVGRLSLPAPGDVEVAQPQLEGTVGRLALPAHGDVEVAQPQLEGTVDRLALPAHGDVEVAQPSLWDVVPRDVTYASATPLWDAVSSYRPRKLRDSAVDAEFEDVSDSINREEADRDARSELADATKSHFEGLRSAVADAQVESKDESDQTQDILQDIKTNGKSEGGFLSTFLSSLVGGFSSLISGLFANFGPALLGVGALASYFMSDGFQKFINNVGGFMWDKAKGFFDRDERQTMMNETRGQIAGAVSGSSVAQFGLTKGAQAAGNAAAQFGAKAEVLSRLANIQKMQGVATTGTRMAQFGNKGLQGGAKALQWAANLSKTPFAKVTGKLPYVGLALEAGSHALDWAGFDAEGREVDLSENGVYDEMFAGQDLSKAKVDPKFAEQAGSDNLVWWDYLSKIGGGVAAGAGVGAAIGTPFAGVGALPGSIIGGIIGGAVAGGAAIWSMSSEAKHDYRKFAQENPQAFLNLIAAKRAGVALDRIDFSDATGKGDAGFIKFVLDNKWDIDRLMHYSPESRTGVLNSLALILGAARQNPNKMIKDLPVYDLAMQTLGLVSATPVYNKNGQISDLKVNVAPLPISGMGTFGSIIDDAIVGDWFSTDKTEVKRLTKEIAEVGDYDAIQEAGDFRSASQIIDRPGIKRKDSTVDLKGVKGREVIGFANGLPTSVTGEVVITSGKRGKKETSTGGVSPHYAGTAIDLRYTDSLGEFLASKQGYEFMKANNIDVNFIWGETDLDADSGGRHFHVQRYQASTNPFFYDPVKGWDRYNAWASVRLARAKANEAYPHSAGSNGTTAYSADRAKLLSTDDASIVSYGVSGSFNAMMADTNELQAVSGKDWQYESGHWWSGITNAIKTVGSVFSDKPLELGEDVLEGSSVSGAPVFATPTSTSAKGSPTVTNRKLQTPILDSAALASGASQAQDSAQGGGGSSYVDSSSVSSVVYNNSTINVKNNLYTKMS